MRGHSKTTQFAFWIVATLIDAFPDLLDVCRVCEEPGRVFGKPNFIIKSFLPQNYTDTLTDPSFQRYLINSLVIATSNSLLVTALALLRPTRCRATSWPARRTSSSGRSPIAWPRLRCSCCRSSCFTRTLPDRRLEAL